MVLGERRLAAAFFVRREGNSPSLEDLVRGAGMQDTFTVRDHPEPLHGTWAGMKDCYARVDTLPRHFCFQIYFWLSSFFDLRPENPTAARWPSRDGAWPIAEALARAAGGLGADAAVIVTHLEQATPEYLLGEDVYAPVRDGRGDELSELRLGLLYLGSPLVDRLLATRAPDRDVTRLPRQRCLAFAGKGDARWSAPGNASPSPSDKMLVAAMFVSREHGERSSEDLLGAAGMQGTAQTSPGREVVVGRWADMDQCRGCVDVLSNHYCVQVYFPERSFLELRRRSAPAGAVPEQDGAWPVADATRKACERLDAEAALVVTDPGRATAEYVRGDEIYGRVLGLDGYLLFVERPGLLYLDEELAEDMLRGLLGGDRDVVSLSSDACLVFAGAGESRWF